VRSSAGIRDIAQLVRSSTPSLSYKRLFPINRISCTILQTYILEVPFKVETLYVLILEPLINHLNL
jgi:hypothetical protein